jgi:hypothetical protein
MMRSITDWGQSCFNIVLVDGLLLMLMGRIGHAVCGRHYYY